MTDYVRKPEWLKVRLSGNENYNHTKNIVETQCLHTICKSGKCPNITECWSRGTATFMIGGEICTRSCRFCNTLTGKPLPLDPDEPERVAESIRLMKIRHAVITSVDRDDLTDMSAHHWAKTINKVRERNSGITIEVLIPDFQGRKELLDIVIEANPDIVSHNMETIRRLTPGIRSAAKYDTSLDVLTYLSSRKMITKTGIMVGLGETSEEIYGLMDDVLRTGTFILTIGQYLQPSRKNIPVKEYITPGQFDSYTNIALEKGFKKVESSPLVRSSYHAEKLV
ncbi:MAG: lipoyl synthase [Tannerellaceae bacterium]|nr:lipoyl synthase [Tannerellaceae bacterium]